MWKNGSWINTFTRKKVFPLSMTVDQICIEDIAHALSNLCRFTGHGPFYSVAQHSVYVALLAEPDPELMLWGLLHDGPEAYINDLASPIKHSPLLSGYRRVEQHIISRIIKKFSLSPPVEPQEIKYFDAVMCSTEAAQFGLKTREWRNYAPEIDIKITPWAPKKAEKKFLSLYKKIIEKR
jgi:hypothetical protein